MGPFGIFLILVVVAGFALIRSARRHNRYVWGPTVCRNGGCRFRNRSAAKFCARCGRSLEPS